jgi:phytoene dehydrogenase-like protein
VPPITNLVCVCACICCVCVSTPACLLAQFYIASPHGESYGLAHTPARYRQDWLQPRTPLPGLLLCGQDVVSAGVMGAQMGGFFAAIAACPSLAWENLRILVRL